MLFARRPCGRGLDRRGHALRSLAGAWWFLGANEEALDLLRASLTIFTARDMPTEQAMVHTNLGQVYGALGRDDLALVETRRAIGLSRGAGDQTAEVRGRDQHGRALSSSRSPQRGRPGAAGGR